MRAFIWLVFLMIVLSLQAATYQNKFVTNADPESVGWTNTAAAGIRAVIFSGSGSNLTTISAKNLQTNGNPGTFIDGNGDFNVPAGGIASGVVLTNSGYTQQVGGIFNSAWGLVDTNSGQLLLMKTNSVVIGRGLFVLNGGITNYWPNGDGFVGPAVYGNAGSLTLGPSFTNTMMLIGGSGIDTYGNLIDHGALNVGLTFQVTSPSNTSWVGQGNNPAFHFDATDFFFDVPFTGSGSNLTLTDGLTVNSDATLNGNIFVQDTANFSNTVSLFSLDQKNQIFLNTNGSIWISNRVPNVVPLRIDRWVAAQTTNLFEVYSNGVVMLYIKSNGVLNASYADPSNNIFIGIVNGIATNLTTGYDNTVIGANAFAKAGPGNAQGNTIIGAGALTNSGGSNTRQNTAIGSYALASGGVTTTRYNTMIGSSAGSLIMSGTGNTFIGQGAGGSVSNGVSCTNASYSTLIGYDVKLNDNLEQYQIVIGNSAIGHGTRTMTLGGTAITNTFLDGGATTISSNLVVNTATSLGSTLSNPIPTLRLDSWGTALTTNLFEIYSNGVPMFVVRSNGNVMSSGDIGAGGSFNGTNTINAYMPVGSTTGFKLWRGTSGVGILDASSYDFNIQAASQNLILTPANNYKVGVGSATPDSFLTVSNTTAATLFKVAGGPHSSNTLFQVNSNATVGIGVASPTAGFSLETSSHVKVGGNLQVPNSVQVGSLAGYGATGFVDLYDGNALRFNHNAAANGVKLATNGAGGLILSDWNGVMGSSNGLAMGGLLTAYDIQANHYTFSPVYYDLNDSTYFIAPASGGTAGRFKGTVTVGGSLIGTNGGTFGAPVTSTSSSTSSPAATEFVVAEWVRGLFSGGTLLYNCTNQQNVFTNMDFWYSALPTTNTVQQARTYNAVTTGQYLGTGIASTNRYQQLNSPMTVNAYLSFNTGGGRSVSVHPEFYYCYSEPGTNGPNNYTNLLGDYVAGAQSLIAGTNLYTWVISFPTIVSTNANGFWAIRRFKVDAQTANPNVTIHGSGNTPSTIGFNNPTVISSGMVQYDQNSVITNVLMNGSYQSNTISTVFNLLAPRQFFSTNAAANITFTGVTGFNTNGEREATASFMASGGDIAITIPNPVRTPDGQRIYYVSNGMSGELTIKAWGFNTYTGAAFRIIY